MFLVTAAELVNDEDQTKKNGDEEPPPLKDPCTISKPEFRVALMDSIANPMYDHSRGGRPPTRTLEVDIYIGVIEGEIGG